MTQPKKSDLLKCKTRQQVLDYAKEHRLPVRDSRKPRVKIGGWICVFAGDKFQYVE